MWRELDTERLVKSNNAGFGRLCRWNIPTEWQKGTFSKYWTILEMLIIILRYKVIYEDVGTLPIFWTAIDSQTPSNLPSNWCPIWYLSCGVINLSIGWKNSYTDCFEPRVILGAWRFWHTYQKNIVN